MHIIYLSLLALLLLPAAALAQGGLRHPSCSENGPGSTDRMLGVWITPAGATGQSRGGAIPPTSRNGRTAEWRGLEVAHGQRLEVECDYGTAGSVLAVIPAGRWDCSLAPMAGPRQLGFVCRPAR